MITSDDLQEIKSLINDFKPEMGHFEITILAPQMYGRVDYVYETFAQLNQLAADPYIASLIDSAVREAVMPDRINLNHVSPQAGVQYLAMVRSLIESQYLIPISELKARFPLTSLTSNGIDFFISYLNEVRIILGGIATVKEKMFTMVFRPIVQIIRPNGSLSYGRVEEISIILAPFETRIVELATVAQATIDSINLWNESLKEQRIKHTEMIANIAQVKVAKEQTRATKLNIWVQVAVVVLAIVLSFLSQPLSTYIEKKILEVAYAKSLSDIESCKQQSIAFSEKSTLDSNILKKYLDDCKSKKVKPEK